MVSLALIAGIAVFIQSDPLISEPSSVFPRESPETGGRPADSSFGGRIQLTNAGNPMPGSAHVRGTARQVIQRGRTAVSEENRLPVPAAEDRTTTREHDAQDAGAAVGDEPRAGQLEQTTMPRPMAGNSGSVPRWVSYQRARTPVVATGAATGLALEKTESRAVETLPSAVIEAVSAVGAKGLTKQTANTVHHASTPAPVTNGVVTNRPPWPQGSFTPAEELYRAQYGWAAFSEALREEAIGPAGR